MRFWKAIRRFLGIDPTRYTETHHLTPNGWVQSADAPLDRVETWKVLVEWPSFGMLRKWWCIWASPAMSRDEREALRAKYPIDSWLRYRVKTRVAEPLGASAAPEARQPTAQMPDKPIRPLTEFPPRLTGYWIVSLVALAILAIVLAAPHLQHSYLGAYISGKCSAQPAPKGCL